MMLKIPYANYPGLSLAISAQFKYVPQSKNREKKSPKPPFLKFKVVQGHGCWYLKKLFTSIMFVPICNGYHVKPAVK